MADASDTTDPVLVAELASVRRLRVGTAGGVHFDLSHNDLPLEEWTVPDLWQPELYRRRSGFLPFLWFPWYGEHAEWKQLRVATASADDFDDGIDVWEPECFVMEGDIISLREVMPFQVERTTLLDAKEERTQAVGWLLVTRRDGVEVDIEVPVPLFRRRHLTSGAYSGNEFEHVCARLFDPERFSREIDANNQYLLASRELARNLQTELKLLAEHNEVPIDANDIGRLISLGVALGRMSIQADQHSDVLPLAQIGEGSRARAAAAGRKSGDKRRAARKWVDLATKIALARFQYHTTQISLVAQVSEELESLLTKVPSEETIGKHVRKLQRDGILPPSFPRVANKDRD